MKDIEKIKEELIAFGKKYRACEEGLEAIKGDTLIELFTNIRVYMYWCKGTFEKTIEFNNIFNNELVIEDGTLLCCCSNEKAIKIPNSVTSIGVCAFSNCTGLTSVTIPNSVTSIGRYAFYYCKELKSITIPNSVTSIEYSAFENCKNLKSIVIPNSVTHIGNFAFAYCGGLTSVIIPKSVTSIDKTTFDGCNKNLEIIRK